MNAEDDGLWYKDAIIYQLHVKSFFDADDDGIGDFVGLIEKLDYVKSLGATCVWLLPFYPSPLKDDGYDIADYRNVNPAYGTLRDFREFVRAAHARGLRVLIELVINHTSDAHPWFQRARRARKGSAFRDYYVWSDSDQGYPDARIIFTDTEKSNWTWDPVAGQYYWHRFFAHQPDLNFDNPRVAEAVIGTMRFWLDFGVDGLRLDAVPYLFEREGTNCENLPETHAFLRRLRTIVDHEYPGRVLLAEANQWPEDVRAYFGEGEGDECNMAFHFPLMPRMFIAIAEEDRYPIVDIMRQTPEIPATAQWAIFLRNHDEMTLEMVTAHEREYMYKVYATEPRARINLGIRRRLAPLMENDRRRIELLIGLLMSMPGTPILYYGDEIGMGDNIYLNDRDGVRTPMQWSMDRNGGFSRANPARLYCAPIMDSVYGYQSVNVEAQSESPSSLLNWLRKLIALRQGHQVFGRGSLTFLAPSNRKILAYLREYGDEVVLCVANLSHSPQQTGLDLSRYSGRVPIEMLGWSAFAAIGGERYYSFTLPGHAFFWFLLSETAPAPVSESAELSPELLTIVLPRDRQNVSLAGNAVTVFERDVLPSFLPKQRWFSDAGPTPFTTKLLDSVPLAGSVQSYLTMIEVPELDHRYFLPLAIEEQEPPSPQIIAATLARVRRGAHDGVLCDGFADAGCMQALLADVRASRRHESPRGGTFVAHALPAFAELDPAADATAPMQRTSADHGTTTLVVAHGATIKGFRQARGPQPELDVARFLSRVGYRNTPPLLGYLEYERPDEVPTALALVQRFAENQGDAWSVALAYLDRFFERRRSREQHVVDPHEIVLERAQTLGVRMAELHRAFATPTGDPAFDPELTSDEDVARWVAEVHASAVQALRELARRRERIPEALRPAVERLLVEREGVLARIVAPPRPVHATKTRYHGDLHLGRVLVVADDFLIVDFDEVAKSSPLHDVACMLRSIGYAATAALLGEIEDRATDTSELEPLARDWEQRSATAFLDGYRSAIGDCSSYPDDPAVAQALLDLFVLQTSFRSITYELANRPTWLRIPLEGIRAILDATREPTAAR